VPFGLLMLKELALLFEIKLAALAFVRAFVRVDAHVVDYIAMLVKFFSASRLGAPIVCLIAHSINAWSKNS